MAVAFPALLFFRVIVLLSATVSLALGHETVFVLALNDIVTFNLSASCPNGQPRVTVIVNSTLLNDDIKKRQGLTTNDSITDCCPAYVYTEVTVQGIPSNDKLVIGIEISCGANISPIKSSSQQISLRGITPARDVQYSNGLLSWRHPYFHSADIPQISFYTYTIILDGISLNSTAATSVWLNVSDCTMEFHVSIVASVYEYESTENITIQNNNYTAELVNATYNSMERTIGTNITFKIESNRQVCEFIYFVCIIFGNGTVRNYSIQVVPPQNKKEIIISEMIYGLDLGNNTIKVTFNVTEEVLIIPIDYVISASPTISSTLPTYSSFSSSITFSSSSSSSAEQSSETSNIFLASSRYGKTPTSSSNNGILVKVILPVLVVALVLLAVVLIAIGWLVYYLYKRKKVSHSDEDDIPMRHFTRQNSKVFESDEKNENTCEHSDDDSHNNTVSTTVIENSAPRVPNPPLAARPSEATEAQYSSLPVPSSGHKKICHTSTSPPKTVHTESTVAAKTDITSNNESSISDKFQKNN